MNTLIQQKHLVMLVISSKHTVTSKAHLHNAGFSDSSTAETNIVIKILKSIRRMIDSWH